MLQSDHRLSTYSFHTSYALITKPPSNQISFPRFISRHKNHRRKLESYCRPSTEPSKASHPSNGVNKNLGILSRKVDKPKARFIQNSASRSGVETFFPPPSPTPSSYARLVAPRNGHRCSKHVRSLPCFTFRSFDMEGEKERNQRSKVKGKRERGRDKGISKRQVQLHPLYSSWHWPDI